MINSTGIAVIQDNKLLLGYRTDGQGWSLAGGKQEHNESLEECAHRELFEEFGITSNKLEYLGQIKSKAYIGNKKQVVEPHIYICHDFSGQVKVDRREILNYMWVNLRMGANIPKLFPPTEEAIHLLMDKIMASKSNH